MIIENINSVIEITNALICLHLLNRKKITINMLMIFIIVANVILIEIVNTYQLPAIVLFALYFALVIYNIIQFDNSVLGVLVDMTLLLLNMGIIQLSAMLLIIKMFHVSVVDENISAVCNVVLLFFILIFERLVGYSRVKKYVLEKSWLTYLVITVCIVGIVYGLVGTKIWKRMPTLLFVWIVFFCTILFSTWYRWIKQKEISREREHDLQIHKSYYDSFTKLIGDIRERQHDYKNQIQAVYNQYYMDTIDEKFVSERKAYCQEIRNFDRYSGLLKCSNSIIAGFLYGKFTEAERMNVEVKFSVGFSREHFSIPLYIIIEVMGIILDNAIEAVLELSEKIVYFECMEYMNTFKILCKNEIIGMNATDFILLFEGNKSTKGRDRGIGLRKLKKYSKLYGYTINVDDEKNGDKSYIIITITL